VEVGPIERCIPPAMVMMSQPSVSFMRPPIVPYL
jgi:hypothetical protein